MTIIKQSNNEQQWPRHAINSVECRKRDLVIRIADWTRTKDEPAYDVEVYVGGVYDWDLSKTFTTKNSNHTKAQAKAMAVQFAAKQIASLL